jgi:hypothetical protein
MALDIKVLPEKLQSHLEKSKMEGKNNVTIIKRTRFHVVI